MTTKLIPIESPKVGDLVFSVIEGNGVIIDDRTGTLTYPIAIKFATNNTDTSCTMDGRLYTSDKYPTIYQGNHEPGSFELDLM